MIKNVKITVETDEQNQYVLNKLLDVNKGFAWSVYLQDGNDYYNLPSIVSDRAVCSAWKGFRHLVIDDNGDLLFCVYTCYYDGRKEKEITFEEFREMVESKPKDVIVIDGIKYKRENS